MVTSNLPTGFADGEAAIGGVGRSESQDSPHIASEPTVDRAVTAALETAVELGVEPSGETVAAVREGHGNDIETVEAGVSVIDPAIIDAGGPAGGRSQRTGSRSSSRSTVTTEEGEHGSASPSSTSSPASTGSRLDVLAILQREVPGLANVPVQDLARSFAGSLQQALGRSLQSGSPKRTSSSTMPKEDALAIKAAVRRVLREQMHVRGHGSMPPYPIPTGRLPGRDAEWQDVIAASTSNQDAALPTKPLRIDWLAIDKASNTTQVLLNGLVSRINDQRRERQVPIHCSVDAIREQAWKVLRDYRADFLWLQRRPDDAHQRREQERERSRRAERRKEKSVKRLDALARLDDYEGSQDVRNFALFEDAMSMVETDEEETAQRSARGEPGKAGLKWIPAWRSQEHQQFLDRVDTCRDLRRSTISALPNPRLRFAPLPAHAPGLERWMVSQAYQAVFPGQEGLVANNSSGPHHSLAADAWGSSLPLEMPQSPTSA